MITLQASRRDGQGVTAAEFLDPLAIRSGEVEATYADGGAWSTGMVYFAVIRYSDLNHIDTADDEGAQSEAFSLKVAESFQVTARFLNRRIPEVTSAMRSSGLSLRLYIEVRMDQDRMELDLPPELLCACSRHGLGVYIISNDF
jgi:hypothetical protein